MLVLLVDDETLARARLRQLLADCDRPKTWVVGEAATAADALAFISHHDVDLVFLDISMPGISGIDFARRLSTGDRLPLVIFVTAHPQHALEAFEIGVQDYLVKPVRMARLQIALEKAETALRSRGQGGSMPVLSVDTARGLFRVPLDQVLYFRAVEKLVAAGTTEKQEYLLDSSLTQLEEQYADYFLRVHRSALVSRNAIRALERRESVSGSTKWVVLLQGCEQVFEVSRRQLPAVRESMGGA